MPTVGEQLRQGRIARNLSVTQVADATKIRSDHIRALEDGNYSVFSAPVYIRGFVRTYASLVKLDATSLLEQLGRELADSGRTDPSLAPPARGALDAAMFQLTKFSRRAVWQAVGVVALLAGLVAGYMMWSHYQDLDPTAGLGEGFYPAMADKGDTLPLPVIR